MAKRRTIAVPLMVLVFLLSLSGCSNGGPRVVKVETSCVNWSLVRLMQEYRAEHYTIFAGSLLPTGATKVVTRSDAQTVFSEMRLRVVNLVAGPQLSSGDSVWVEGGTSGDLTVVTDQRVSSTGGSGYFAVRAVSDVGEVADDWYPVAGGQVLLDGVCQQPGQISSRPLAGVQAASFANAAASKSGSTVAISTADFEMAARG